MKITPQIAQRWLDDNPKKLNKYDLKQRHIKETRVNQYAAAMQRGEWRGDVSPIALAGNGAILNGLNRVAAIVRAGVTVDIEVLHDVEPATFPFYDTNGSQRTITDVLDIADEADTKVKATLLNLITLYLKGDMKQPVSELSAKEQLDVLLSDREDIESAVAFARGSSHRPDYVAFMHYLAARNGFLPLALPFLEKFKTGLNLASEHEVARLLRDKIVKKHIHRKDLIGLCFAALNRVLARREILKPREQFTPSKSINWN